MAPRQSKGITIMTNAKSSTAAVVRAWAAEQSEFADRGFRNQTGPIRGRLPQDVITAFNKAHRGAPYASGGQGQVEVKVPSLTKSGRKGSRLVRATVPALRQAARDAGVEVKGKGRLTDAQMVAGAAHLAGITLPDSE